MPKLRKNILIFHFFITLFSYSLWAQLETPITSFPEGFFRGRGDYFDLDENVGRFYSIAVTGNQIMRFYHRFEEQFVSYIYEFSFIEHGLFNITIQEIIPDLTKNISIYEGSGFCNQKECFLSVGMDGYYLEEIIRINNNDGLMSKYSKRNYEGNIVYLEEQYYKTDVTAVCGDGVVNSPDEQCDDGNVINGDGCDISCHTEELSPPNIACTGFLANTSVPGYFDYDLAHVSSDSFYDIAATGFLGFSYYIGSLSNIFNLSQGIGLTNDSYGITFVDIDQDGDEDILTAGPNGDTLSPNAVSLNTLGVFAPATTLFTSNGLAFYGSRVVAGDFNRDETNDAIWFSSDTAYYAVGPYGLVPTSSSNIPFGFPTIYPIELGRAGTVTDAKTADLNNDGYFDAIVALAGSTGYDGGLTLLMNSIEGPYAVNINSSTAGYFEGSNLNPFGIAAGDFNEDGKTDIAFFNNSIINSGIIVGLRTSATNDTPTYDFTNIWSVTAYSGIAAGDFNNDGFDDIVVAIAGDARLLEGNGAGAFTVNPCSLGNMANPKALDVDGDGYLDLTYQDGFIKILYARTSTQQ